MDPLMPASKCEGEDFAEEDMQRNNSFGNPAPAQTAADVESTRDWRVHDFSKVVRRPSSVGRTQDRKPGSPSGVWPGGESSFPSRSRQS